MSINRFTTNALALQRRGLTEMVGPVGLAGVGVLHVAWAAGWRWPGGTDAEWASRLAGATEPPPAAETGAVAVALLGGAGVVFAATSRDLARGCWREALRLAAWAGAVVLIGRAFAFLPSDLSGEMTTFNKLDLAVYAPLSALLGVSIARSLRRSKEPTASRPDPEGEPT